MGNLKAAVLVLFASSMALVCSVHATCQDSTVFYWGADRGRYIGSDTVELMLNKSGGTGIKSNVFYMYGSISFSIKLPSGNSAGTVATFYLSSYGDTHDEIDFEFLGNVTNEPYTIHTNIYTQGYGKREIQFKPWFDPTDGYHTYTIFWNLYEVVWMVDGKPIRVYRKHQGYDYPDAQPMKAYASFWNADDWATQKGRVKTDWSLAPFKAMVQNYKDDACKCTQNDQSCVDRCSVKNENNWWTKEKYQKISPTQKQEMDRIRANYMIYDFCADPKRFNGTVPQECSLAQY